METHKAPKDTSKDFKSPSQIKRKISNVGYEEVDYLNPSGSRYRSWDIADTSDDDEDRCPLTYTFLKPDTYGEPNDDFEQ